MVHILLSKNFLNPASAIWLVLVGFFVYHPRGLGTIYWIIAIIYNKKQTSEFIAHNFLVYIVISVGYNLYQIWELHVELRFSNYLK